MTTGLLLAVFSLGVFFTFLWGQVRRKAKRRRIQRPLRSVSFH